MTKCNSYIDPKICNLESANYLPRCRANNYIVCTCEGNRCNCDFYANVREKAKQQKREDNIPTRISDLIIKINKLDLSGYENEEIRRVEIVNELIEIKTIIERRNT